MAYIASYYENNSPEMYSEGPFVITKVSGGGRIEVEGVRCPALPDGRVIQQIEREFGFFRGPIEDLIPICDRLNSRHRLASQ